MKERSKIGEAMGSCVNSASEELPLLGEKSNGQPWKTG